MNLSEATQLNTHTGMKVAANTYSAVETIPVVCYRLIVAAWEPGLQEGPPPQQQQCWRAADDLLLLEEQKHDGNTPLESWQDECREGEVPPISPSGRHLPFVACR